MLGSSNLGLMVNAPVTNAQTPASASAVPATGLLFPPGTFRPTRRSLPCSRVSRDVSLGPGRPSFREPSAGHSLDGDAAEWDSDDDDCTEVAPTPAETVAPSPARRPVQQTLSGARAKVPSAVRKSGATEPAAGSVVVFPTYEGVAHRMMTRSEMRHHICALADHYCSGDGVVHLALGPSISYNDSDPLPPPLSQEEYFQYGTGKKGPKFLFLIVDIYWPNVPCQLSPDPSAPKAVWFLIQINRDSYVGLDRRAICWDAQPGLGVRRRVEAWVMDKAGAFAQFHSHSRLPTSGFKMAQWNRSCASVLSSLQFWLEYHRETAKDIHLNKLLPHTPASFTRGGVSSR